jgi:hypothetical protein
MKQMLIVLYMLGLFLDVYVPGKAIRKQISKPLPVLHWIYGYVDTREVLQDIAKG